MSEKLPNILLNISAIYAVVLKDPDVGTALADISDGKTFGKEVDNENEIVDKVKLNGLNKKGANDTGTKIDNYVVSGRV